MYIYIYTHVYKYVIIYVHKMYIDNTDKYTYDYTEWIIVGLCRLQFKVNDDWLLNFGVA